jgi:thermitase
MEKRMQIRLRLTLLVSIVVGLFFSGSALTWAGNGKPMYLAGELLIQTKAGASKTKVKAALKAQGAVTLGEIEQIRVKRIKVPVQALEKVRAALSRNPHFSFVENNFLALGAAVPNDPRYPSQWHLPKISAPGGWDVDAGSPGEPIAIIDSGVDPTHPDLAAKLTVGYNFLAGNTDTHDVLGHGTAVAGTAAAMSNNLEGVAGVAWENPIMPLVVLGADNRASYYDIARAVTYAADHGARVMNISIGGSSSSSTLQNAVTYAWNKGALIFVSAANYSTSTPYYPAACTDAVAVSATTSTDTKASFSNYGDWIDIAAPGVSILTTNRGGGYGSWSGTSFSSPIAAGLAALIWSVDPSLTNAQVLDIMTRNADDLGEPGFDPYFGYGRVNVSASLAAAANSLPAPDTTDPFVSFAAPADGATLTGPTTVRVSAVDNVGVDRVELRVNGTLLAMKTAMPYDFYWDTRNYPEDSYDLSATAYDESGNAGQARVTVSLTSPPDTDPPSVTILSPEDGSTVSGAIMVSVSAADDVALDLVGVTIDGKVLATKSVPPYDFLWDTAGVVDGEHEVVALASDISGNLGQSAAAVVTVLNATSSDTSPPQVSITSPRSGSTVSASVTVKVSASDNVGVAGVELYINGTLQASSNSGTLDYSWNTTALPNGSCILSAAARDASLNIGTSPAVTVEVSNLQGGTTPLVSIQSPEDGSSISDKVVINAAASDGDGISQIEIYIDGSLVAARAKDSLFYNWNTRKEPNGPHRIEAKAYDTRGNVGTHSVTVYK